MLIGAAIFATDYAIRPDELARELEQRGYESLWLPEHTHIPASRRSPYPGSGELPKEYWHTYDPFLALTAAATTTRKLRLATAICLIIERDPIITAKEVASLDMLCDGRLPLGYRMTVSDLVHRITDLRRQAEGAGRDPKSISITVFGASPQPATIEELAKAGVERAVFMLPSAQRDIVLPLIDKYTSLMK